MQNEGLWFDLHPRHRVKGKPFGDTIGVRRGQGEDQVSSRAYEFGDDPRTIDRHAYSRDPDEELTVRVTRANESIGVVLLVDRMPTMQDPEPGNPFRLLPKHTVTVLSGQQITNSAKRRNALVGYRDFAHGELFLRRANASTKLDRVCERNLPHQHFGARAGMLASHLADFESAKGAFVFVISDFLDETLLDPNIWEQLIGDNYDPVPVLIQDPVWEQTFPTQTAGLVLPFRNTSTGNPEERRYSKSAALKQQRENEARLSMIRRTFQDVDLDVIELSTADPHAINNMFRDWAAARKQRRYQ